MAYIKEAGSAPPNQQQTAKDQSRSASAATNAFDPCIPAKEELKKSLDPERKRL